MGLRRIKERIGGATAARGMLLTSSPELHDVDLSIETLRGLAVLLLVSAHVIGLTHSAGMRVGDGSIYRHFTQTFTYVRMPLFTAISGYVYDRRPAVAGKVVEFLRGKARRLLLPMLTVSTLEFLAKSAVPGVHNTAHLEAIGGIYLYGFDHFWFLQALTLVFIVIALLESWGHLRHFSGWLGFWVAAALAYFFAPRFTGVLSFPSALFLLPFFMLGMAVSRFADRLQKPQLTRLAAIAFVILCGVQQAVLLGLWHADLASLRWFGFLAGVSVCLLLLRYRRPLPWLAWIGSYAYSIYLLHVFGASGSRIVLQALNLDEPLLVLIVGMVCGIGLPILADRMLRLNRWARLLLLGLRAERTPSPRASRPAPAPAALESRPG